MRVDIIDNTADFERLRPSWNTLLSESQTGNIFLTFEWLFTYWRHFGKEGALRILAASDCGKTLALFPFMIKKRLGLRELRFLSSEICDYDDFLLTREPAQKREALGSLVDYLGKGRYWDVVRLKGIREDSPAFNAADMLQIKGGRLSSVLQQHCDGALQIDLKSGWDTYYSGLRKSFLADIRGFRKRAGEAEYLAGGTVREDQLMKLLDTFMDMHIRRRGEAGDKSFFQSLRVRNFFKDVFSAFHKNKWLDVSQYRVGGAIAAMEIGFVYQGRFLRYLAAFDSQFKRCAIGRLLLFEIIKDSFARGLESFDFMLGEEDYKRFWNPRRQALYFWTLYQKTPAGRLSYLLLNKANLLYKKLMKKKW